VDEIYSPSGEVSDRTRHVVTVDCEWFGIRIQIIKGSAPFFLTLNDSFHSSRSSSLSRSLFFRGHIMGISNVPFPSFTLVLTSDHVIIPGRSMVIRIEPLLIKDNLMVSLLLRTCRTCECKSFLL
jgi:hypothetical protein